MRRGRGMRRGMSKEETGYEFQILYGLRFL